MDKTYNLNIKTVIDSEYAVSAEKAEKVSDLIRNGVKDKKIINVSFSGLSVVITAFLNIVVGDLYDEFDDKTLKQYVNYIDCDEDTQKLIELVISKAKKIYKR